MNTLIFFSRVLRKINYKLYRLTGKHKALRSSYEKLDAWIEATRIQDACITEEIAAVFPMQRKNQKRQLFFDVTTLSRKDEKTGIQRVVRSILREWLAQPPHQFSIQPVFACAGKYKYAREFLEQFSQQPIPDAEAGYIDYRAGDMFISIDFDHNVAFSCENFYQEMRQQGVKVYFVVHDLLCMTMPKYFFDFAAEKHERWLKIAAANDGCVCVSKTVADEVLVWLDKNVPQRAKDFQVMWFHLGADIEHSKPTFGLPANVEEILPKISAAPSFLMVSTLEPRKGHQHVLKAFDVLWQKGDSVNLVIVGKQGWKVRALVSALRKHAQLNQHLFWFEGVSDEFLEKIYQTCDCLIAASEGEGFGLPLIEAARHGLPIIARDIPVFHEVTQDHAFFFNGKSPKILAAALQKWLILFAKGMHPTSEKMQWSTWQQSAQQLLSRILSD